MEEETIEDEQDEQNKIIKENSLSNRYKKRIYILISLGFIVSLFFINYFFNVDGNVISLIGIAVTLFIWLHFIQTNKINSLKED